MAAEEGLAGSEWWCGVDEGTRVDKGEAVETWVSASSLFPLPPLLLDPASGGPPLVITPLETNGTRPLSSDSWDDLTPARDWGGICSKGNWALGPCKSSCSSGDGKFMVEGLRGSDECER